MRRLFNPQRKKPRQFKDLLKAVKEYSNDVRVFSPKPFWFACGTILGYKFRLFEDVLLIKDERADGSKWPAFYNKEEIDEWVLNKKLHHFISRQKDLDPEFNNIVNENFDELLSDKPKKKKF